MDTSYIDVVKSARKNWKLCRKAYLRGSPHIEPNALTVTTIVIIIVKWIAMFEGPKHRGAVSSMHSNWDFLDHVGSGEYISQHPDKPSA